MSILLPILASPELGYSQDLTIKPGSTVFSSRLYNGKKVSCLQVGRKKAIPGKVLQGRTKFRPAKVTYKQNISKLNALLRRSSTTEQINKIKEKISAAKQNYLAMVDACRNPSAGPPVSSIALRSEVPTATNEDILSISYEVYKKPYTDVFNLTDGENSITIGGNKIFNGAPSMSFIVVLDRVPPQLEITSHLPDVTTQEELLVNFKVDGVSQSSRYTLVGGLNVIDVSGTDLAGNKTSKVFRVIQKGNSNGFTEDFNHSPFDNLTFNKIQNLNWDQSSAISASSIDQRKILPSSLIGYWGFDTPNSNMAQDQSGNNNNGTFYNPNGIYWSSDGFNGGSYRFTSAPSSADYNGHIRVESDKNLNLPSRIFTTSFWMYPRNAMGSSKEFLVDKYGDYTLGGGFRVVSFAGRLVTHVRDTFGAEHSLDLNINTQLEGANRWTHVALTYDGIYFRAYKNGVETMKSNPIPNAIITTNKALVIGERYTSSYSGYNGSLDEVMVFNQALSGTQIKDSFTIAEIESKSIGTNGIIYGLRANWISSGSPIIVEVTFDNGQNWCNIENGMQLTGSGCTTQSTSFRYRVRFPSTTSILDSISFSWSAKELAACNDGLDNDKDGLSDGNDPGCESIYDNNEDAGQCEKQLETHIVSDWSGIDISQIPNQKPNQLLTGWYFPTYINSLSPVHIDMNRHFSDVRKGLERYSRDSKEPFILDWETWGLSWDESVGNLAYQYAAAAVYTLVESQNPTWSSAQITAEARRRYNERAREMTLGTIRIFREMLPNAKIGFYGYPVRDLNLFDKDPNIADGVRKRNDDLAWLWREVDLLTPSFYHFYPSAEGTPNFGWHYSAVTNANMTKGWIEEVNRIKNIYGKKVYPFMWMLYHPNGARPWGYYPLSELDLKQGFDILTDAGVSGYFLWNTDTEETPLAEQSSYNKYLYTPEIQRQFRKKCS